ncbi:MaoC family dehydratase N-terminal domain-containing protein [Mameliella alba]|nr:MaoC family dehydratase N-terminal domain-containing protein [Mameliella alba]MBY6171758.1 MaoC family dehydratase N-terminal domain-containing protein [Mameliella alba]MBY6176983.1 MaoC family dehydratase N-terminal domain-containing protein [Mameliella alba]
MLDLLPTIRPGVRLGPARRFPVSQARIDQFAECTEDHQWIHVDPSRARNESPTRGTIAHGYLTLSFLVAAHQAAGIFPQEAAQVLNYGLDKVRFLAPVPSGAELSFDIEVLDIDAKSTGLLLRTRSTICLAEDGTTVAVAEALFLVQRS